jgi:magnesium transporter
MRIIEFDFAARVDREVPAEVVPEAVAAGRYCWIDARNEDRAAAETLLERLRLPDHVAAEVFGPDREGRCDVYEACLHLAVNEAHVEDGRLSATPVDVVLAPGFMFTYRTREVRFLQTMRETCHEDFVRFSRSPGFLLYEVGDHLLNVYRQNLRQLAAAVQAARLKLFGAVDDAIFRDVAALTSDLVAFRRIVLAARDIFHELATRRSAFVSETTQPFLDRIAQTLERLSDDLAGEREVLSEALNLYLGIVGHRTNRIVSRLTVISLVFLPLSFLCGVYGMNFERMPELSWRHGYLFFWGVALLVGGGLLYVIHRKRWI